MSVIKLGNFNLTLSDERVAYSQLRLRYLNDARFEQEQFTNEFSSLFTDADDLFAKFPAYLEEQAREVTEDALADITTHHIYDVDEVAFEKRLADKLASGEDQIEHLFSKYRAIGLSAAELEAQRAERAANGPRVIGGGFGVEGAARGMAEAAVANVAIGMIQGIANAAASGVSSVSGRRKKAQLFADPATRDGLAGVVFDVVYRAHLVVAEIVNERSAEPVFAAVASADAGKAAALLSNVSKDRVPVEERPSVLFQALRLDPFSKDIWFEWLDRFGDRDGSLAVAAEQIGIVELPERKRALIAERLAALPTSTPEECQATIANLVEYARSLGEDVEAEKARLLVTAEDLDVQRRSFRGQVYTTQEEAKSATDEWTKVELDRVAAEMSSEKLKIQREGDRLVIGYHENTYRGEREVLVNRLLKLEAKKLRPPNEVPWIITLVIAGLFLLPFGGIGLLPLVAGLAIWHVNATRRENRLCRMYPEVFESSKARSRARP